MNKLFLAAALAGLIIGIIVVMALTGNLSSILPQSLISKKEPVKIGILYQGGSYKLAFNGLKDKLAEDGFTDGKNVTYIIKELSDPAAATEAAKDLISQGIAIFYSISTPVTSRVKEAVGETAPIVFNIVGDPVGAGFIKSFAEPGANLTGCTNLSASLSGKRLEIFKMAFPALKRVVTFYDPTNKFSILSIENTRQAAAGLGIEVKEFQVKSVEEIEKELAKIRPGEYNGIYNTPDARAVAQIDKIVARANELKIPVMGHEEDLAGRGVSLSYGANFYRLGRDCASVVENILNGSSPRTEPVISPSKLDLVINQAALDKIGLSVSKEIQSQADKIIKQ
ncbi:MAG: ABC transporter substrate-binding protein [Candidatus Niyogibacteria bacterium]|nr:ABC transporter substrate-binding protein [Candidatus Niyogibacteria bacterium]